MLAPDTPEAPRSGDSLFETGAARGTSRVICFSPDHGKSLPEPALPALEEVVDTWCRESVDRGAHYPWVQVFECSFQYSMGWHGAPFDGHPNDHWQLHAHLYPPPLRSSSIRKYMVGYEMLAEAQRDLTPEQTAERLRSASATHYRESR